MSTPFGLSQNPAPNPPSGQAYLTDRDALVQSIMASFRAILPSNYVAQTNGPWYTLQFQAMAEQLADIQIATTEIYKDSSFDFTRTDFLWQVVGGLVFPGATDQSGIPQVEGDTLYRDFLRKMVGFLLSGSRLTSLKGGLEALDEDLVATLTERYLEAPPRDTNGAYTIEDQFIVDILISNVEGDGFPADPFVLQQNASLVLAALKPAHVLYTYSYLFRDAFEDIVSDEDGLTVNLENYYYDDPRSWWLGVQRIIGEGDTLALRTLFTDPDVSFVNVRAGAVLVLDSGVNAGVYRVTGVKALLSGAETMYRPYTLSTGGSGTLIATDADVVEDPTQDWGALPVDTQITITEGPNAGTYRLDTVLGLTGGPIGKAGVSGTRVRVSPSTLVLSRRMPSTGTGQGYTVSVDRLGRQTPRFVVGEDVSTQFYL